MKALVVLSGGADSTTALYWAKKEFDEVEAVFFNYGSRQNKTEIIYARKSCKKLGVKLNEFKLDFMRDFKSDLLDKRKKISDEAYNGENIKNIVVPFRNGIMLSAAAGLAESNGLDFVVLGNHSGDHEIYPDCRPEFIEAIGNAIKRGTNGKVRILSPFCDITKSEIVKKGAELGVDYSLTYSCYCGEKIHCGVCPTCRERKEAFIQNNIKDETKYKE